MYTFQVTNLYSFINFKYSDSVDSLFYFAYSQELREVYCSAPALPLKKHVSFQSFSC